MNIAIGILIIIAILITNIKGQTQSIGTCSNGEGVILSTGKCYTAFAEVSYPTYNQARTKCQTVAFNVPGELVSIHSATENQLIYNFAFSRFQVDPLELYLGAKIGTVGDKNSWYWLDGSPWDYSEWVPGYPNEGRGYSGQECLRYRNGVWWDWHCNTNNNKVKSYVCQATALNECAANPAACWCDEVVGYFGNDVGCTIPICFGIPGNFTNACSGHGTCTSPDTCSCDGGYVGSMCQTACSPGTFVVAGGGSCSPCTAGYYCDAASSTPTQHQCSPGTYSGAGASSCSDCFGGYYCTAGSPSATQNACSPGQYAEPGATSCADCEAGYYCGATSSSSQENQCSPGTYAVAGSSSCTNCNAGYICGAGSITPTETQCPGGTWSSAGSAVCQNCPAGYRCPAGSTSGTTYQCAAGQYALVGSSVCTDCDAGYYCNAGSSSSTENQCPAGQYSNAGSSSCTACDAGYICTAGSTSATQIQCPAGTFAASGASSCDPCNGGYYCTAASPSATQNQCPAGQYSQAGSSSCSNCYPGYACAAGSPSPTQTQCAAGTYSPGGFGTCQNCDAGYYCNAGSPSPKQFQCPPGTFSTTGSSSCSNCTAGYYCSSGSSSATQYTCPAGSYSPEGSSTCTICNGGTYCPAASPAPTQCPDGKYALPSSASCTNCTAGYYCSGGSSSPTQNICPATTYSESGWGACQTCLAGKYCPQGSSGYDCPDGTYSNAGASTCSPCTAGYYCTGGSPSATQNQCPAGKYSTAGSASCSDCTAGYICAAGSPSATQTQCSAGTYSSSGSSTCSPCSAGYYCLAGSPSATQYQCGPGTWSAGNAGSCPNCDPGYYCTSGSTSATQNICPAGSFSTGGAGSCTVCPAGNACLTGATSGTANPCPPGKYSNPASSVCSNCSAGYYCTGSSPSRTQNACPAGTYSIEGSSSCSNCTAGYKCTLASTSPTQNQCPGGYWAPEGSGNCYPCDAGYYCNPGSNSATQHICAAGSYSTGGNAACMPCSAGYSCPAGSTTSTPNICPPGKFSLVGASTCTNCSAGYYCPTSGSSSATQFICSAGTYSIAGSISCSNCSAGHFCVSGSTSPTQSQCSAGTYALEGSSHCKNCDAGYYCPPGGISAQHTICPPGTFSYAGSGSCSNCSAGHYCTAGSDSPTQNDCTPGSYSNSGFGTCLTCDPGYQCPARSTSATQNPCPVGTYSLGNASSCSPCNAGYYCVTASPSPTQHICPAGTYSDPGSGVCTDCQAGYYCNAGSTTPTQHICLPGTFSNAGASQCSNCSGGYYCSTGSTSNAQFTCTKGTYSIDGSVSCTNCTSGYYCTAASTSPTQFGCSPGTYSYDGFGECKLCSAGYYCTSLSTSPTQNPCPPGQYSDEGAFTCKNCSAGYYCTGASPSDKQHVCPSGWHSLKGAKNVGECDIPVCFNHPANSVLTCSSRGTCVNPDDCSCNTGYDGAKCEFPVCYSQYNNSACHYSNGTCISPNNCLCNAGYYGSQCEKYICYGVQQDSSSVCSGNGHCYGKDACVCDWNSTINAGYVGQKCEYATCFGKEGSQADVCSGHGSCTGPNECTCTTGFTGIECQLANCNGRNSSDPMICSGNGICVALDVCNCTGGFHGYDCQTWSCNGVEKSSTSTCSGHGACTSPENCVCFNSLLYTGAFCQYPICYGNDSSVSSVCSNGNGVCVSPDNCECHPGFQGDQCQASINNAPVAILKIPQTIGQCDDLVLDGSLSYPVIDGPITYHYSVTSASGSTNLNFINYFFNRYHLQSEIVVLPHSYLDVFATYTFELYINSTKYGITGLRSIKNVQRLTRDGIPQVVIEGSDNADIYRDQFIQISGIMSITTCNGVLSPSSTIYRWEQIEGPNDILTGLKTSSRFLKIPKYTFPVGSSTYKFKLTAIYQNTNGSAEVTLKLKERDLVPVISGGDQTSSKFDQIVLDSSSSYDPENENTTETFTWSCPSCPTGFPIQSHLVQLAPNSLPVGNYEITLTYSKGHRTEQVKNTLKILLNNAPKLKIKFPGVINPNLPLELIATSDDLNLQDPNMQMYWTVKENKLELSDSNLVDRSKSKSRNTLALKPNALTPGETYEFVFTVVTEDAISYSSSVVKANTIPQFGTVKLEPSSGFVLDTTFSLTSIQWFDEQFPLRHKFYIIYAGETTPTILRALEDSNKLSFQCGKIGSHQVFVEVCDTLGGCAKSNPVFLNVLPQSSGASSSQIASIFNLVKNETGLNSNGEGLTKLNSLLDYVDTCDSCSNVANDIIDLIYEKKETYSQDIGITEQTISTLDKAVKKGNGKISNTQSTKSTEILSSTCSMEFSSQKTYSQIVSIISALSLEDTSLLTEHKKILECIGTNIYKLKQNGEDATLLSSEQYSLASFKDIVAYFRQKKDKVQVSSSIELEHFDSIGNENSLDSYALSAIQFQQSYLPKKRSSSLSRMIKWTTSKIGMSLNEDLIEKEEDPLSPLLDIEFYNVDSGDKLNIHDLSSPFSITFNKIKEYPKNRIPACFYYDESSSKWLETGLLTELKKNSEGVVESVVCKSNHATSFTIFTNENSEEWNIVMYVVIGCVGANLVLLQILLIACCISCICCYRYYKKEKKKKEELKGVFEEEEEVTDENNISQNPLMHDLEDGEDIYDVLGTPVQPLPATTVLQFKNKEEAVSQLRTKIAQKNVEINGLRSRRAAIQTSMQRVRESNIRLQNNLSVNKKIIDDLNVVHDGDLSMARMEIDNNRLSMQVIQERRKWRRQMTSLFTLLDEKNDLLSDLNSNSDEKVETALLQYQQTVAELRVAKKEFEAAQQQSNVEYESMDSDNAIQHQIQNERKQHRVLVASLQQQINELSKQVNQ